jgi:hypothetical protein
MTVWATVIWLDSRLQLAIPSKLSCLQSGGVVCLVSTSPDDEPMDPVRCQRASIRILSIDPAVTLHSLYYTVIRLSIRSALPNSSAHRLRYNTGDEARNGNPRRPDQ